MFEHKHKWVVETNLDAYVVCEKCGVVGSLKYLSLLGLKSKDIKHLNIDKIKNGH